MSQRWLVPAGTRLRDDEAAGSGCPDRPASWLGADGSRPCPPDPRGPAI